MIDPDVVPASLRDIDKWVRWKLAKRAGSEKPTKVPYHPVENSPASTNDPDTWGTFADAVSHVGQHGTCGIGYVLTADDPYVGVDFDHVLQDGYLDPAAATIIEDLHSYSEVSPSGEGVRVIVRGSIPTDVKHTAEFGNGSKLEFWSQKRFITVTGDMLPGSIEDITDASEALCRIIDRYDLLTETGAEGQGGATPPPCALPLERRIARAQKYVAKVPGAIDGAYGSNATFLLAQRVVRGFCIPEPEALDILRPWNATCVPPWPEAALARKINEAATKGRMEWACMIPTGPVAVPEGGGGHEPAWRDSIIWTKSPNGGQTLKKCVSNASLFLSKDPEWAGHIRSDVFGGFTVYIAGGPIDVPPGRWTDQHTLETWRWLESNTGLFVSLDVAHSAIRLAAADYEFHPLQEWLKSLVWDGVERLDTWLDDLAGVERTTYAMAVGRKFLVSAVARAFVPGTKADHAMILEGPQGIGKSTLLSTLFSPWFTDEISVLGSKDASMQLRGTWCVEIGELESMHRSEISAVKAFISRTVDRYRPAYGRDVIEVPRTAVFTGSTNAKDYLRDDTGARRFWPIACQEIDIPAAIALKDQLWAEAVVAYYAGEKWWMDSGELTLAAVAEQAGRLEADPWESRIEEVASTWGQGDITTSGVLLKIGVELPKQTRGDQMRAATCLKKAGYVQVQMRIQGVVTRLWRSKDPVTTF